MANKETTSSTTASIRTESNKPETASVPASTFTNRSIMSPSSASVVSSSRTVGRRGQPTQGATSADETASSQADYLLRGIGLGLGAASSASGSACTKDQTEVHDADGADAQPDELKDTLKRMHSDNMTARKKRRQSAQASTSASANVNGDASASANTDANTSASATTSNLSPGPKDRNTGLPRRSKPE